MRLKRLEMVGFKSFADRTRVEFEPGITAVVGPNGCGKSNISDSIRWALGEMSAKSLRSQQMLDVIFNGTSNRPAQGMSEVSLTFDNTSGKIPLDYTEVTVARRLFRSGESEYFINKTQCRLKDVRDLFLDTGIGSDGYYIMAQGKIEFILASKPEERRELFEEAAGVSKYKVRREEALRRLNKVEQDMLRLNDSLAIYKQQMDSLDAAVRKAKQHQKLTEELRTLEIATHLQNFKQIDRSAAELRAEQERSVERLNALKDELAQKESGLTQGRERAQALEEDVIALQRQVAQCESDWAKTEAERKAAEEREAEFKTAQGRLREEIARLDAVIHELTPRETTLAAEVEELRAQFKEKNEKFKSAEQKGSADQTACHQLQKELEKSKARLLELARLLSHHRNEIVRLTSLCIRDEEATKAKAREAEKVSQRRAALTTQVSDQAQQAAETEKHLAVVHEALRALQEAQKTEEEQLQVLERSIQSARERLAGLEAEKSSLEHWLGQNPSMMASAALRHQPLPGIYGPVGELLKTEEPYRKLLERALGDRSEYFVADTLNDAQAAVRFLSENRKGWATFLVLDRLAHDAAQGSFDAPGSRSLAEAVQCDLKFRPVVSFLFGKTFYLGETLFEEALLRGGSEPQAPAETAASYFNGQDLIRLNNDLEKLRADMAASVSERDTLKATLGERESQRVPLEAEAGRIQVSVKVQQETLARLNEDWQMSETEDRLLQKELQDTLQSIDQTKNSLRHEETLLAALEGEEKTLQEAAHTQDMALQGLRQTVQAYQVEVSTLRLDAETTRERLLGKEREHEGLRREMNSVDERLRQDKTDFETNDTRLKELAAVQVEKSAHLDSLRGTKDEQQTALARLSSERQEAQETLRVQEDALAEQREALSAAQSRAQEIEFQMRSFEQERARVEQALKETYQFTIEEGQAHYGELQPNPEEVVRIRRRLESLGPVNLAAPEEHAQLEERYHFLLTQQQDLLQAKDDLHQAIAKINATTREHFKTTFEQVRQNFKALYQTLFQGGEADVILTNEHDLLETGVDIFAQPPGKKLQNIALLSGGEKALTAIALLFAFFMVKPSPFCMLDEVDAPLDEANVGRFLKLVKTFAEKTQFIMITHNKRSMEMADVLYGVTMAELGISSLISVKLESAKETAAA